MAHVQYLDELIREYLLFRGFSNTLKAFDAELKIDKDKGFRVDRVLENLLQCVNNYDLPALRDLWIHLDQRMFSKLEHDYSPVIRKLESSLYKYYLVNAIANNKPEKVVDFFSKLPELQGQPEWRDWFMLPYTKNPEEIGTFAVHFSKQWQDTLIVSLHNFLSIIYQVMPQPVLSSYEEEAAKLRRLQEENETLKQKLAALTQCGSVIPDAVPPMDIMDDFYIIAQEMPASIDSQGKTVKSLIRTIAGGLPTSPVMNRKGDEAYAVGKHHALKQRGQTPSGWVKHSVESVPKRSLSLDSRSRRGAGRDVSVENVDRRPGNPPSKKDSFLPLSQEKMTEHKASVTQCRFNAVGSLVASTDVDGIVKVWSAAPSPKVLSTMQYKGPLTSLSWFPKNERYFLTGSKNGLLRLHDFKESKTIWEIGSDDCTLLKDSQILSICCSPTECSVACTTVSLIEGAGKLLLFDIKSRKLERVYNLGDMEPGLLANCCLYNHNGTLLMAGCSDGVVRTVDLRHSECLSSAQVHDGPVTAIQVTSDHTLCYTMGADHMLARHSLAQNGEASWSACLPKCHTTHGTQGFALHQSGRLILTACGHGGANVYQVTGSGMQLMLQLGGHRSPLVVCDWTTANQCATCLSGSTDGKIKISTILTQ